MVQIRLKVSHKFHINYMINELKLKNDKNCRNSVMKSTEKFILNV